MKEYIEIRYAEEGGFDWVSEIRDDKGNSYGCSWNEKSSRHDYGYEPEEINSSDKYDVSIWEWAEDRYEKVCLYI